MVRQQANRLIAAAETVGNLEPMGSIPQTERQARLQGQPGSGLLVVHRVPGRIAVQEQRGYLWFLANINRGLYLQLVALRADDANKTNFMSKFAHKVQAVFLGLPKMRTDYFTNKFVGKVGAVFSAEYAPLSPIQEPKWRVKTLLTKLDSDDRHGTEFANKFVRKVIEIFSGLPKPKDWQSFQKHDLPLLFTPDEAGE